MTPAPSQTVAPWSREAEIAVLGAALQDPHAAERLAELRPVDFFLQAHGMIAAAIGTVRAKGLRPDVRTVGEHLSEKKHLERVGGAVALFDLVEAVPTVANLEHFLQTVKDKSQLRRLLDSCTRAAERAKANGTRAGDIAADLFDEIGNLERTGEPGPILVKLSEVQPESIAWIWDGRLAVGKLTLIVGDPGLGKSYLTMDLTARVTCGGRWPDGTPAPSGDVVVLTAEDGLSDTVRPRLDLLGGDPARVHVLTGIGDPEKPAAFTLQDIAHLEDVVCRTKPRLIVIDPLSAYIGAETNSHRDADVRGTLAPLAALAERHRLAALCVLHLNKSEQQKALYRVSGTLAFVAAARAVFAVTEDPEDAGRRLFCSLKNNLGPKPPTLAFRIDAGGLRWEAGTVSVDADTALQGIEARAERSERDDAMTFLRELLANGSASADDVQAHARKAGVSEATLRRAKAVLGVESYRVGYPGQWWWRLKGALQ